MFVCSVQTIYEIFRKVSETFRVMIMGILSSFSYNLSGNIFARLWLWKYWLRSLCEIRNFSRIDAERFLQETCVKYFNKCCSELDRSFREMFVSSVQTIHKIFRKSIRNHPCNDCGNRYATFLVMFGKYFFKVVAILVEIIWCLVYLVKEWVYERFIPRKKNEDLAIHCLGRPQYMGNMTTYTLPKYIYIALCSGKQYSFIWERPLEPVCGRARRIFCAKHALFYSLVIVFWISQKNSKDIHR